MLDMDQNLVNNATDYLVSVDQVGESKFQHDSSAGRNRGILHGSICPSGPIANCL